jgi:hypothetical protein
MKRCTRTQGDQLVSLLKIRPHTYMQMLRYGISCSPWKRVQEWLDLNAGWKLVKQTASVRGEELTTWRVVKA